MEAPSCEEIEPSLAAYKVSPKQDAFSPETHRRKKPISTSDFLEQAAN